MIVEIVLFCMTALLSYLLYIYKWIHRYFDKRGVKYVPGVPIFGNIFNSTFLRKHVYEDIDAVYRAFPNEKYVGYIEGISPIFLVRDPELIKTITIKDFENFVDHKEFFSEEVEPLFGGSLLMLKGEKWHDMRSTLSPAFTGSKMRRMMPFMTEISANIIKHLEDHSKEDVDVDDIIRRYTNDVIASAAFGLKIDSLKDKDNEFYKMGQNLFNFSFMGRVYMFIFAVFPKVAKKLGLRIFPQETTKFFKDLVFGTMDHRKKNNIERPDMIQLLMEASKGSLKDENESNDNYTLEGDTFKPKAVKREWSQNELAGQVFIFFAAGFESSANALVLCVHELALHPDVQDKLYHEVLAFKKEHGELTYDNLNALKYLDCVLNETSRKWAAAIIMDRVCNKEYELPPPREGAKPVKLKPGDVVYNMVNSIHMDPRYHPDPETFNPDRFSDENKHAIKSFTFMPFGMGPRICIGSRFAQMELKIMLYYLVLNFEILKCSKTLDPITIHARDFNMRCKDGSWVRLEKRI